MIAHHGIIPYTDYLYDSFRDNSVAVEIRTKSANINFFKEHKPLDNLIIAFTLTPDEIIGKYEKYSPSLDARIKTINTAISEGFKVRICFDPVFADESVTYENFFEYIFSKIDSTEVYDVGYGFFRMPKDYFNKICKCSDSTVFVKDFVTVNNTVTYSEQLAETTMEKHLSLLEKYIDREKIYIYHENCIGNRKFKRNWT